MMAILLIFASVTMLALGAAMGLALSISRPKDIDEWLWFHQHWKFDYAATILMWVSPLPVMAATFI